MKGTYHTLQTAWEKKYHDEFLKFIKEKVIEKHPHFIVPVARKACKLLDACDNLPNDIKSIIRYKNFFKFNLLEEIADKTYSEIRIAVLDDVSESTKSLLNYRKRLIALGFHDQNIYTYSFKGHYNLFQKKDDDKAIIGSYLTHPEYNEYLFEQTTHFLLKCVGTDIDHLVLRYKDFNINLFELLKKKLDRFGYVYELPTIGNIQKFSVHCNIINDYNQIAKDIGLELTSNREFILKKDFIEKIRFVYNGNNNELLCIPMVFPKMDINIVYKKENTQDIFKSITANVHFEITKNDNENKEPYYNGICLILHSLLFKYVFQQLQKSIPEFYDFLQKVEVKGNDFEKIYPKHKDMVFYIKSFLSDDIMVDKYFLKNNIVQPRPQFSHFDFSKNVASDILTRLRKRYKNRLKHPPNQKNRGSVKYSETVDQIYDVSYKEFETDELEIINSGQFNNVRNINPLAFTELIDELCDLTILVPTHRTFKDGKEKGIFSRTYRSGEVTEEFNYQRSKHIFHIALSRSAIKNKDQKVKRMLLEKLLANYSYDFYRIPKKIHNQNEIKNSILKLIFNNHIFESKPSYWGPQSIAILPFHSQKVKLNQEPFTGIQTLDEYQCPIFPDLKEKYFFGIKEGYYGYDEKEKTFNLPSSDKYIKHIEERDKYLNDKNFFINYFDFLLHLDEHFENYEIYSEEAGSETRTRKKRRKAGAKINNTFILCRDFNWFCHHVFYNINEWVYKMKKITHKNNNLIDQEVLPIPFVLHDGQTLASITQKLEAAINAENLYKEAEKIAYSNQFIETFGDVWNKVIKYNIHIDDFKKGFEPLRNDFQNLLNAMYSLSNLLKQKVGINNSHEMHEVQKYTPLINKQLKSIGIDFEKLENNTEKYTIEEFITNVSNKDEIKKILIAVYRLICDKIQELKQKTKYDDLLEKYEIARTVNMLKKYKSTIRHCFASSEIPLKEQIMNHLEKITKNELETTDTPLEISEELVKQILKSEIIKQPIPNNKNDRQYILELPNKRKLSLITEYDEFIKYIKILPKVFVSYSQESEEYNNRIDMLVEKLRKEYYMDAWNDTLIKKEYAQFEWDEKIKDGILNSDKVIFIFSKGFKQKVDIRQENIFDYVPLSGVQIEWQLKEEDLRASKEPYNDKLNRKYLYAHLDKIKNEERFEVTPSEFIKKGSKSVGMHLHDGIFEKGTLDKDFIEKILTY